MHGGQSRETAARPRRRPQAKRRGGFLFGAVAGAVAGLLLAPKSGKETRAQLFGEGGIGGQVDRLKGAIGAGKDSAADQSEALQAQDRGDARAAAQPDGRGGNGVGGEDACGGPPARARRRELSRLARNGLRAAAALDAAAALGLAYLLHEAQWVRRVDRRLRGAGRAARRSTASPSCSSPTSTPASARASTCAPRARPSTWRWRRGPTSSLITGDFAGGPHGSAELQRQLRRSAARRSASSACSATTTTATARRRSCGPPTRA